MIQEAIDWIAAEYKFLQELHYKLSIQRKLYAIKLAAINRINDEQQKRKLRRELLKSMNLRQALTLARYIGKAERRADKPLHDILNVFLRIDDAEIRQVAREIDIPNKLLSRSASLYFGTLRRHLKKLSRLLLQEELVPRNATEKRIQQAMAELETEVGELETSAQSVEAGLEKIKEAKSGKGITRRAVLQFAGAAGVITLLGNPFTAFAQEGKAREQGIKNGEPGIKREKVIAGKLYFYNWANHPEMPVVVQYVEENFNKIGIFFEKVQIISERQFSKEQWPELKGLDFLLLILPQEIEIIPRGTRFLSDRDYNILKPLLHFPYDSLAADLHVGFVKPHLFKDLSWDSLLEQYAKSLRVGIEFGGRSLTLPELKLRPDFRRVVELSALVRLITHEVAHHLGAAHVGVNVFMPSTNSKYFESNTFCHPTAAFHPENIQAMKEFIRTVKVKSLGDAEMEKLRQELLVETRDPTVD